MSARAVLRDVREDALLVEYPEASAEEANRAAVALGLRLRAASEAGLRDAVPGARTLLVVFEPDIAPRRRIASLVASLRGGDGDAAPSRSVRIPAIYDGEDLEALARERGLPAEEIARRHAAGRYRVAFVGFAPGFAYLSGLPPELASPRLPSPRARVPSGAVAIGGAWTGIYPAASPGGWRLIGRTTARLFDPSGDPPSLLAPGDRVAFERVAALPPPPPAWPAPAPASVPVSRAVLRVLAPGLFTTVQGAPRTGLGASGVPPGGAMDVRALARANALAGNAGDAPALEATLSGPELEALRECVVAVAGAEASVTVNGAPVPFGAGVLRLAAGARIRIGRVTRGVRVYLALRGGAAARAGEPLGIVAGDEILCADAPEVSAAAAAAAAGETEAPPASEIRIRVLPGPESAAFPPAERERFLSTPWRVTPESDRRGLRLSCLSGPALAHGGPAEIEPSGTVPGTIQVPGSGLPIVLGPDGPVTGGYPRIATAIGADLPLLGQAGPGAVLRFAEVSLAEALSLRPAGSTMRLP